MQVFGYINGKRVQLDNNEPLEIAVERPLDDGWLSLFNSARVLAYILLTENGQRAHATLQAQIHTSGSEAKQRGVALSLHVNDATGSQKRSVTMVAVKR
jgi:hypothetical protein